MSLKQQAGYDWAKNIITFTALSKGQVLMITSDLFDCMYEDTSGKFTTKEISKAKLVVIDLNTGKECDDN
jgi:hypothetical protein